MWAKEIERDGRFVARARDRQQGSQLCHETGPTSFKLLNTAFLYSFQQLTLIEFLKQTYADDQGL